MPRFIKINELPHTNASVIKIIQGRKREELRMKNLKPKDSLKAFKFVKNKNENIYFVNLQCMPEVKSNIKIQGMTCGHCKNAVENILKEEKGVLNAEVFLENAIADVTFDDSQTSLEKLKNTINESGIYKAS
jgi:copper chaperone